MATITSPLVSVEEYLARTEKPNCEYQDGILYPKPLPTSAHSYIQTTSARLLTAQGALALTELTLPIRPTKIPGAGRRSGPADRAAQSDRTSSALHRNSIARSGLR